VWDDGQEDAVTATTSTPTADGIGNATDTNDDS
jgi:hypothetical protein